MDGLDNREALISALLREDDWRERVVEEFVFGAGEHVRVSSTFQFGLSPELLSQYLDGEVGDRVRLFLPVTTREKSLLLNFDLRGPNGEDGFLLPRDQIGVLHANYLSDTFDRAGLSRAMGPEMHDLLKAICTFAPTLFMHFLAAAENDRDCAVATYLSDGLSSPKHPFTVDAEEIATWDAMTQEVRGPLLDALREPQSDVSSAENVLLALPSMDDPPKDKEAVFALLHVYNDMVQELDDMKATTALHALANSGRRWIVVAELNVPVGQRFAVALSEDRPLELQRKRRSRQRFALGDADRAHLEVRVSDSNVHLNGEPTCRDPLGQSIGPGLLEAIRFTSEATSLYSSVRDRPRFADVEIELRLTHDLRLIPLLVAALAAAATIITLLLPVSVDLLPALTVVAVPITVAAALLAVREQTALASRLQAWPRTVVVATTTLLWAAVLVRLLWAGAALPPWHGLDAASSRAISQTHGAIVSTGGHYMATNGSKGDGRVGAVRGRSQAKNAKTGLWTKRDTSTGRFMNVKKSGGTFKGIKRER